MISRYKTNGSVDSLNGKKLGWWTRSKIAVNEEDILYTVQPNETLLSIAYLAYNDSSLWWKIAMRNKIIDPTTEVYSGRALYIPPKD
jgi:nucleoid-associated protein YgaU